MMAFAIPTSRKGREKWGTLGAFRVQEIKVQVKVKINVKGDGKECAFHMGTGSPFGARW